MKPKALVRLALLFVVFLSAGGCATVLMAPKEKDAAAKTFATAAELANLYVYRASEWGTGVKYPAMLDGKMLGELPGSTFIFVQVAPGPHTLYVSAESSKTVAFVAEAGKSVYIKVTPVMGWAAPNVSLTLMTDEKEAQEDVKGCSLIQGM
jgi:uncharacterized protein YceK